MSFQAEHGPWPKGTIVNGKCLASCPNCGLLRVENASGGVDWYIRPGVEGEERVANEPGPCLKQKPFTLRPRW